MIGTSIHAIAHLQRQKFTGVLEEPGRGQPYTVWFQGYIVGWAADLIRAERALELARRGGIWVL